VAEVGLVLLHLRHVKGGSDIAIIVAAATPAVLLLALFATISLAGHAAAACLAMYSVWLWITLNTPAKSELQKQGHKLPIDFRHSPLRTRIEKDLASYSENLMIYVVVKHTLPHCALFALLCAPLVRTPNALLCIGLGTAAGVALTRAVCIRKHRMTHGVCTAVLLAIRVLLVLTLPPAFFSLFILLAVLHFTRFAPSRSSDLDWLLSVEEQGSRIPVLILTGYLGSGKTTLLNHILRSEHGQGRIAVIENEMGEVGVDGKLVENRAETTTEEIVAFDNGCICCNIRGDLVKGLRAMVEQQEVGSTTYPTHTFSLRPIFLAQAKSKTRIGRIFDLMVIETTGVADPAPVAQTFFVEPEIQKLFRLDAVVCLVDAFHFLQQLQREAAGGANAMLDPLRCMPVGQSTGAGADAVAVATNKAATAAAESDNNLIARQVMFADRVVVNKIDLVSGQRGGASEDTTREGTNAGEDGGKLKQVMAAVHELNPMAEVVQTSRAAVDLSRVLNTGSFSLERVLESMPQFTDKDADVGVKGGGQEEADPMGGWSEWQPSWASNGGKGAKERQTKHGVSSVGFDVEAEFDLDQLNRWVVALLKDKGADIYRFKGVFAVQHQPHRFVFHGVHMTFEGKEDRPWNPGETRRTTVCFIGRQLDRLELRRGLDRCIARAEEESPW
jgi:G3E family GTPase